MSESTENSDSKFQQKPYELDDHWKIKEAFIERYKDEIPENKLLCLAQLCVNVETLGVGYSKEVSDELSRLCEDVPYIEEYRQSKERMSTERSNKKKVLKKARHSQRQANQYQSNNQYRNYYNNNNGNNYNTNNRYNQYNNQQNSYYYNNNNRNPNSSYPGGNYNSNYNSNYNQRERKPAGGYGWQQNQAYGHQFQQNPKPYQRENQPSQYNRQAEYDRRYQMNNYQQQQLRNRDGGYQSANQQGSGYHETRFNQPRNDSRMSNQLPYADQYRQNRSSSSTGWRVENPYQYQQQR